MYSEYYNSSPGSIVLTRKSIHKPVAPCLCFLLLFKHDCHIRYIFFPLSNRKWFERALGSFGKSVDFWPVSLNPTFTGIFNLVAHGDGQNKVRWRLIEFFIHSRIPQDASWRLLVSFTFCPLRLVKDLQLLSLLFCCFWIRVDMCGATLPNTFN